MEKNKPLFSRKSPCKDCPYRMDAPLAKWELSHFKEVIQLDMLQFGTVWRCHKNDGCVCVGWLMDQDNRRLPSIKLRLQLSKNNISRDYLDSLACKSEMFGSIEEMCYANYHEEFIDFE